MDLKTEGARSLLAYWESQKGERRLPSTADLDLVDLAPILSNLIVYEKSDDDFTVRFFGTKFVQSLGVDLTGTKTSAFADIPFGRLMLDHLTQVIEGPSQLVFEYQSKTNEGPVLEMEQIMLPWGDANGDPQCVLSHLTRTSGADPTVTLKLEKSFQKVTSVQTVTL